MVCGAVRGVLVCAAVILVLAACGRRGPLEPPRAAAPGQTQTQAQADAVAREDDEDLQPQRQESTVFTPLPTAQPAAPSGSAAAARRRGYTVPDQPFVLDGLL